MFKLFWALAGSAVMLTSCGPAGNNGKETLQSQDVFKDDTIVVKFDSIHRGDFDLEITSNGKVKANKYADIKFPFAENIQEIFVHNGDQVKAGQLLAKLNNTDSQNKLNRTKESLARSLVELDDRLIDYGFRLKDSAKIPPDIMRMARMKSGYNSAFYDNADAKRYYNKTNIIAPFSGKIANLEGRVFNVSESYKKLCSIIDDKIMQVEFSVLETEYHQISKKSAIEVVPYSEGEVLKGFVTQINPLIDDNGMIKISAVVNNPGGILIDGMNVKIIVKKTIKDKFFVLKTAIVQRQNREVVFTYEQGRAKWNYVETGLQNNKYICINSGLSGAAKVISGNNTHLTDGVEIKLEE
jgi:RND family efflux transporter MFP subunit